MEDIQSDMIKDFVRKCKPGSAEKAFGTTRRLATRGHRQPIEVTHRVGHFSIIPKIEAPNEHNTGVEAEDLHQTATRKPNCFTENV